MRVLGIADNHDAGAALAIDGVIVAAVGQERVDRMKNSGAFPAGAIDACLQRANLTPGDLDRVVVGTTFTPAAALRWLRGAHHRLKAESSQFSYLLHLYILYQVALRGLGLVAVERLLSAPSLLRSLRALGFYAPLSFVDHHTSHAATAYLTSGMAPALVLTLDAMGDGVSVTVHRGEGGRLIPLYRQSGFSAINTLYSRTTEYLGFTPLRHEGKLTGLAAYVPPPADLTAHFASLLHFKGPGFSRENYLRPARKQDAFWRALKGRSREEVAASLQANLEAAVTDFARHWVKKTGLRQLACAGGVFANVKLNQRVAELPEVEGLYIYPNMSDGGLPAGAALLGSDAPVRAPAPVYLGHVIGRGDAAAALNDAGIAFESPADPPARVAELLAQGLVVARAAGGMEWGPRALGNRSILYRPDDPSVNTWLNQHLRRTEFMPFAPMSLWEGADDRYLGLDKARDAARFMTVCFDVTPMMAAACPGVVHVDGTARPQLVRADDNPEVHRILSAFGRLTGEPTVINTSFNMHEEPIVATAEDAVRAYQDGGLDALNLGPLVAIRPGAFARVKARGGPAPRAPKAE